MALRDEKVKKDMLKGIKCKCGEPSVEFDSWFNWFPCEKHKHLNPVEYSKFNPSADHTENSSK